jgi:hypothetical protein
VLGGFPLARNLLNGFRLSLVGAICAGTGNVVMQTFETTDALDARRCRYAQYGGLSRTLMLCGSPVTGIVRSVMQDTSRTSPRWIIKIAVN